MIDERNFQNCGISDSQPASVFCNQEALTKLRFSMLKFAMTRLYDSNLAEDAVQEALLYAFKGKESFSGNSSFRTWAFGILKNKIKDIFRSKKIHSTINIELNDLTINHMEDLNCHFSNGIQRSREQCDASQDPEAALLSYQFSIQLERALDELPNIQANVFIWYEINDRDVAEICRTMGISEGNFYVLIHRARKKLKLLLKDWWTKPTLIKNEKSG